MNTMRPWRLLLAASLAAAGMVALARPLEAQSHRDRGQGRYSDTRQDAYQNGYREGWEHGEKDARDGRDFAYEHDHDYREADAGYKRQHGDRNEYRRVFRGGYAAGYSEAYGGRGASGQQRGRAVPRGYPTPDYGRYPTPSGRYPDRNGQSGRSGAYGDVDPAYDHGLSDGYEKGAEDARDGDRFDPLRHSRYRSGDHGYSSRYGSREQYKNVYRDAFRAGYDRGYREARQYGGSEKRGRVTRGGWGLPWPF